MKEIIIGIVSGIVSGTGMGGGTILIFLLTFMCGIEQHIAQATNLIFFIPTSIVAIIVNIKNKNIKFKIATIISIFGILGLNAFKENIILIAGGYDKNLEYQPLAKPVVDKVSTLILIGQTAEKIYDVVKNESEKENKKIRKGHNKNKIDRQNI